MSNLADDSDDINLIKKQ